MSLQTLQNYSKIAFAFILATILLFYKEIIQAKENEDMLIVEYIKQCPKSEYPKVESPLIDPKLFRFNRTSRAISFTIKIKRPWDADVGFKIDLEIWRYAGWTRFPYIPLQTNFCDKFKKMFHELWSAMTRQFGIYRSAGCPIPPGDYSLSNFTCSTSSYFPFRGRFKLTIVSMSMRTKEVIMCVVVLINVEERVF